MDASNPSERFEQTELHSKIAQLTGAEWDNARDGLMYMPNQWSSFFSEMLLSTWAGTTLDKQPTALLMDGYFKNANRNFTHILDASLQPLALEHPELIHHLTRLNFHTMNHEMGRSWQHLTRPEKAGPLDYDRLSVTQVRLSVVALQLVEARRAAYIRATDTNDTMSHTAARLDTSFASRVNEIETLITLLEVIRQQPPTDMQNLLVLPTPPGGETSSARGSDFSLIDIENHLIHGIHTQVRSIGEQQTTSLISQISGIDDLDNVKIRERADGTTEQQPIPGLIAADIIFNSEAMVTDRILESPAIKPITYALHHSKDIARPLLNHMDYLNRVSYAAEKVGSRVLRGLFKDSYGDDIKEKEPS